MALTAYGTGAGSTTGTSTTSSSNVYMSEYTGANSQLWCLYSGGMPVFLGNDIRAENGTMYEYDLGISDVWVQPYCYVTEFGDTVSFSSSDSTAIEVASNGKVTAKNAGRVTLTATVKNSAGTVKNTYSYTVTLKLQNGVYYIKNESSGLYLDATGTSLAEGADVVQSSKIETGDARFGQLWRIHYLGDNLYSIRSMRKLDMGLKAVSGNVDLYTIGTADTRAGVIDTAEWNFKSSNSYGYRIQQSGSSGLTLEQSGNGFAVGAYDGHVREFWRFEKVNFSSGIYVFNMVEDIGIGAEHQFSSIYYSENLANQTIQWFSSNEDVATIDESTGVLTPLKRGTTEITARQENNSITFEVDVLRKAFIIVPGILGSELEDSNGNSLYSQDMIDTLMNIENASEDKLWELIDYVLRLSDLVCDEADPSATSVQVDIDYYGENGVNNNDNSDDDFYGINNTYLQLATKLKERMNLYHKGYTVEFFAYDWRMSNADSAQALKAFIDNGGYDNDPSDAFDKVVLIGHSMGGLVISSYLTLGQPDRDKVEDCFFVGTPLLGTPTAPYLLFDGDLSIMGFPSLPDIYYTYENFVSFLDGWPSIKKLLINMPSLYELFPSTRYFDTNYGNSVYLTREGVPCPMYNKTRTALLMADDRWDLFDGINSELLENAEEFHQSLYVAGRHVSNMVSSYYISSYYTTTERTLNMLQMG